MKELSFLDENRVIILLTALMLMQSIFRLFFVGIMLIGEIDRFLKSDISTFTLNLLAIIFFFLGVTGLIISYGIWEKTMWGYWGTVFHSILTILFDIWGLTIQRTAIMGFIPPIIFLAILYLNRSMLLNEKDQKLSS